MSELENLKKRIEFRGGGRQVDRMVAGKLASLKKSLLYSYQSATAVLQDGREFRCLINPNNLTMELDDKMLSIPFEDICLNKAPEAATVTSKGVESIGVKCGDVIEWKENGTHWIVYSQYLQEIAYFRGLMRQCESEPLIIDGTPYWYYLKGPDEKGIDWTKTKNFIFNKMNYSAEIYISNNITTNEFFHRFQKINIKGKSFEVEAVDDLSTDGILAVYLKEDFSNKWAPVEEAETPEIEEPIEETVPSILGPAQVYPYDIVEYTVQNITGGRWSVTGSRASIIQQTDTSVTIEITTGKSGELKLDYVINGNIALTRLIPILSL